MSNQRVEVVYRGLALTVTGNYSKGRPMCMYLRNGDPGYPEDPPEFEISKIELNGEEITDFFDNLVNRVYINHKYNDTDCYTEIEDLCICEIEGGANDEPERDED